MGSDIISAYTEKIKNLSIDDWHNGVIDKLEELYATALDLDKEKEHGDVFVIDDFIENVYHGYIMDYDGSGYLIDDYGNEIKPLRCDTRWLENQKKIARFVVWYNK